MIQTLCDTGPLLAIIDPKQGDSHRRCMEQLKLLQGKLLTTWPCVAEAMHLADNIGGRPLQKALWSLLSTVVFDIAMTEKARGDRMDELMDRYQNVPMDFADASLFVLAEGFRMPSHLYAR